MGKKKRKRYRDLVVLWKGKVARILGQGSDSEVMLLARLIMHKAMTHHEKYLVLEGAIFEVWGQRLADREEEARARRKRVREQSRQEKGFSEPAEAHAALPAVHPEPVEPLDRLSVPEHPLGSGSKSE